MGEVRLRRGGSWGAPTAVLYKAGSQGPTAQVKVRANGKWEEPPVVVVPPDSGTGTPIAALSDITSVWVSNKHIAPATTAHFKIITTPSGPGWEMICDDTDTAPWDSTCKTTFARKDNVVVTGTTTYTFDVFLPAQKIDPRWHCGLLMEWHTANSSGHYLGLDMQTGTPRWRVAKNTDNYTYAYTYGPAVRWDQWLPVRIEIKWSTGSDGVYRVDIGGQRIVDFKGVTAYPRDGAVYLQFGWYGGTGQRLTNIVRFGNLRVQRT